MDRYPDDDWGGQVHTWACRRTGADIIDVYVVRYETAAGQFRQEMLTDEGWSSYEPYETLTPVVSVPSGRLLFDEDKVQDQMNAVLRRAVPTVEVRD